MFKPVEVKTCYGLLVYLWVEGALVPASELDEASVPLVWPRLVDAMIAREAGVISQAQLESGVAVL